MQSYMFCISYYCRLLIRLHEHFVCNIPTVNQTVTRQKASSDIKSHVFYYFQQFHFLRPIFILYKINKNSENELISALYDFEHVINQVHFPMDSLTLNFSIIFSRSKRKKMALSRSCPPFWEHVKTASEYQEIKVKIGKRILISLPH